MISYKKFLAENDFKISYSSLIRINGELENTVKKAVSIVLYGPNPDIAQIDLNATPKISIIIPVFNGEKYLLHVIKSIQFQTLRELEIIFVDDKSTDGTVEKILSFQKLDPRIKLIKNTKNRGILYNRIYGALQARGEYITYIDVDDMYINPEILELAYIQCYKNNLDVLEYDYFGGRYDLEKKEYIDIYLFSVKDKSLTNKLFVQPDIKDGFFYNKHKEDLISGIVYDKLYSRKQIKIMADYIGEDFWNQHFIYMEDFIIALAAARTAERYMRLSFAGLYHWYENPEGMTKGVFDMDGNKLKYPEMTNKKLGDYISMWERAFDFTEDEPESEHFRLSLLYLLKEPDKTNVFASTYHFERVINLAKRMLDWKHSSQFAKNFAKVFASDTISYSIPLRDKYSEFYIRDENNNNNNNKKKKKKRK